MRQTVKEFADLLVEFYRLNSLGVRAILYNLAPYPIKGMKTCIQLLCLFLPGLLVAQPSSGNVARVEVPGVKGVLAIDVGPSPWYLEFVQEDNWAMLHARQRPDHVIITAQLRQVSFQATPESCKAEMWPTMEHALAGKTENLQQSSYGGSLRVGYTLNGDPESGTSPGIKSYRLHAFWGAGDLCVEARLVKAGFTPQDQPAFEQVLGSVRLYPDQSGLLVAGQNQESSSALMAQGNELYAQADYSGALKFYEKAFSLEKQNRTFDKDLYLDLISRLAFCYRLNGNLTQARQTLDYGLSQDAEYPIFHYDMACINAQMGKLDETLGHLRAAYKYSKNASPGQMPPDPTQDSCFQKFANDPQFTDAVQKMLPQ